MGSSLMSPSLTGKVKTCSMFYTVVYYTIPVVGIFNLIKHGEYGKVTIFILMWSWIVYYDMYSE